MNQAAIIVGAAAALGGLAATYLLRRRAGRWLWPYLRKRHPRVTFDAPVDVLICVADHYEPKSQGANSAQGLDRVLKWVDLYPRLFGRFRDSDGRTPRHTFFFPAEEYEPQYLDLLGDLCRAGFGEVEVHLHHHDDTPENFRRTLREFVATLADRHGLLARDVRTGKVGYAFIHGNWALCNCRPERDCCGVDHELSILRETGCFVDMTFPSAPHPSQPPIVNEIYYARDLPGRAASHEVGRPIGDGPPSADELLLVQGPLVLNWQRRKWGLFPRVENGCLQATQLPSVERLGNWLRAGVAVPGRPEWRFVKLHAHGASEDAHPALLDEPMVRFHEDLASLARENPNFRYHYVTAREMYNVAKAAEAGFTGSVAEALDWAYVSNVRAVEKPTSPRPTSSTSSPARGDMLCAVSRPSDV